MFFFIFGFLFRATPSSAGGPLPEDTCLLTGTARSALFFVLVFGPHPADLLAGF